MSRPPKSREINIFNFSFLDILACTIGALIFMLVMIMINSTGVIDVSAYQEERDDLDTEVAALETKRDEITNEIEAERSRREAILASEVPNKRPPEQQNPKNNRDKWRKLAYDLVTGEQKIDELKTRIEDAKKRAKQLERRIASIPPKPKPLQKKIEFNIPLHHETTMPMMPFECVGHRVRPVLTRPSGNVNDKYYGEKKVLGGLGTELIPRKSGETLSQMNLENSDYSKAIKTINKKQHYAYFIVRPDSYDIFRAAREKAWDRGIRVGWEPCDPNAPITLGPGGRGGYQ